jgi:hypothetical protein
LRQLFLAQVLDRGDKIELLVDKTENLRSQVSSVENVFKSFACCHTSTLEFELGGLLSKLPLNHWNVPDMTFMI